jgi:hypothetical protein
MTTSNSNAIPLGDPKLADSLTTDHLFIMTASMPNDENTMAPKIADANHAGIQDSVRMRSMTAQSLGRQQQARSKILHFAELQGQIHKVITDWATTPGARNHSFIKLWYTQWKDRINADTSFSLIKTKLTLKNMEEYYNLIIQCLDILVKLNITFNKAYSKLHCQPHAPASNMNPSAMIYQEPSKTSFSTIQKSDYKDELNVANIPSVDNLYNASTDLYSFVFLQRYILPTLQEWTQTDAAKNYSFYSTWTKWEKHLNRKTTFADIQRTMSIKHLHDYMHQIQLCPAIEQSFFLSWDPAKKEILWGEITTN